MFFASGFAIKCNICASGMKAFLLHSHGKILIGEKVPNFKKREIVIDGGLITLI